MGDQIIGALAAGFMGVVVIAAIYQLGKPGGQTLAQDVAGTPNSAYNATLGALFK